MPPQDRISILRHFAVPYTAYFYGHWTTLHNDSSDRITVQSTSSSGNPKWRQSPIDLNRSNTWNKKFDPLLLNSYWVNEGSATMTNTGKTAKIEFGSKDRNPLLSGGPLKTNEYEFVDMQFRWGVKDCRGAEHSVDNCWYSMEAQATHWNKQYGSIDKCYDKPDGIAILSYFMQVVGCPGMSDNPAFANVTKYLPEIRKMGNKTNIPPDCLRWMAEACSSPGYYTYSGSTTSPPYDECAIWIVIPRPIKVSGNQVGLFRRIFDNKWEEIVANYRPRQPLRGRRVLYANDCAYSCNVKYSTRWNRTYEHDLTNPVELCTLSGLPKYGQSPIDIDDKAAQPTSFPPLILNGYWLNDGEALLKNTGYTANVTLGGDRVPSTVYGGPLLNDEYELHHAEFHWGKEDCNGAEHTINGTWFSMEAQFIHWNRKYLSYEECVQHHDGLCALTYFFLVRNHHNDLFFDKISDHVNCVEAENSEVKIPPNALCWMRQAIRCPGYYTYQGSTTNPPFPECVTWIIFPLVIPIYKYQVDVFRNLKDSDGKRIEDNRRPLQLLKGRRIFWANNAPQDSLE